MWSKKKGMFQDVNVKRSGEKCTWTLIPTSLNFGWLYFRLQSNPKCVLTFTLIKLIFTGLNFASKKIAKFFGFIFANKHRGLIFVKKDYFKWEKRKTKKRLDFRKVSKIREIAKFNLVKIDLIKAQQFNKWKICFETVYNLKFCFNILKLGCALSHYYISDVLWVV